MKRRASRRTQKKYDPSETFSTKDILMAIRLSLGKEPPKRKITLGLPLTKVTARASLNVQHSEKKVTTIKRVSNKSTMQKKNIVIKYKESYSGKYILFSSKKARNYCCCSSRYDNR